MSARSETESIFNETQQSYDRANTKAKGDVLGRGALRGIMNLAEHIDALAQEISGLSVKLQGIDAEVGAGSPIAVAVQRAESLSEDTLSSVAAMEARIDTISERVELMSQRLDLTSGVTLLWEKIDRSLSTMTGDDVASIHAEIKDLQRQVKKLSKVVKMKRRP